MPRHRWIVTAPAYAHPSGDRRGTGPIIQKYDTSELVNRFLEDPRASLSYTEEDQVHRVVRLNVNKFFNLRYQPTGVRKLFLDTHKRFYLVVCSVHCDAPGLPRVERSAICEAGFVVRRIVTMKGEERRQRWVKHASVDNVGGWEDVISETGRPRDVVYPLYPLVPDPRQPRHAGAGHTLYFGLIPTSSTEMDGRGRPRFDDRTPYEIRCFVRQHQPPCPKKPARNDCPGPLAWSPASERYQLAPALDLIGTSYRPVNVQLPDLAELKAQAAIPGIGLRAPVRFNIPERSGPEVSAPVLPIPGGASLMGGICFRNIPLTTIVAMVVYNIFKPIVVAIFQLYYLLPLEFCIPIPSLSGSVPGAPQVPTPPKLNTKPLTIASPIPDAPRLRLREEVEALEPQVASLDDMPALASEVEEVSA